MLYYIHRNKEFAVKQKVFVIKGRGFGDDEDEWENVAATFSLRAARTTVVKLQKEWDEQDGDDARDIRRSSDWRSSYSYEELNVV
jgi:hypothetical protein